MKNERTLIVVQGNAMYGVGALTVDISIEETKTVICGLYPSTCGEWTRSWVTGINGTPILSVEISVDHDDQEGTVITIQPAGDVYIPEPVVLFDTGHGSWDMKVLRTTQSAIRK